MPAASLPELAVEPVESVSKRGRRDRGCDCGGTGRVSSDYDRCVDCGCDCCIICACGGNCGNVSDSNRGDGSGGNGVI